MKTKCRFLQFWLLCAALLPAAVQAQFLFTTRSDGSLNIKLYTGPGGVVVIPSTTNGLAVTSIGSNAFYYCTSLTSVTIPSSVTSIGYRAFFSCSGLTNLTIGTNLASIGATAFYGCRGLTSVTLPNSVTDIGDGAFNWCAVMTNFTMSTNVTRIGASVFEQCYFLTGITIPNGTTSIGNRAFFGCSRLISVTIPNSVTNIGNEAFQGCTSLTAITVDPNNSWYSSVAGVFFNKSQTTLIQFPGAVGGTYTIPQSVTSIGPSAFYHCTGLTSVTIPNSVINIGDQAFFACYTLTNITIGTNVTTIGYEAFYICYALSSVTIPNSVTNLGIGPFHKCTSMTAITVDTDNPAYSSLGGVLFNRNQTTLIEYPSGRGGSYTIPQGVTDIGEQAFDCQSLTNVTIPNSVTNIGNMAFVQCLGLTSITIPNSVTSIADDAFYWCTSLTGVYFEGNAPSPGSDAFVSDDNANVYYLPWTTGWGTPGTPFGDRPTALWLPQTQNVGVLSNQFGFNITWANDTVVVVDACTDLANPDWSPVGTNTLTGGSSYFSDEQWTNYPGRFYRLRSP